MPVVSQAQARFMGAHKDDKGKTGKVAREFLAATPKGSVKNLPARKGQKGHMDSVLKSVDK